MDIYAYFVKGIIFNRYPIHCENYTIFYFSSMLNLAWDLSDNGCNNVCMDLNLTLGVYFMENALYKCIIIIIIIRYYYTVENKCVLGLLAILALEQDYEINS